MAKKTKRLSTKTTKHVTDWKFVILLGVLVLIGIGVLGIYRRLSFGNPESFPFFKAGTVPTQKYKNARMNKEERKENAETRDLLEKENPNANPWEGEGYGG